eukprot:scaffold63662_cov21-Tisochrysis_lutea.AAC.1
MHLADAVCSAAHTGTLTLNSPRPRSFHLLEVVSNSYKEPSAAVAVAQGTGSGCRFMCFSRQSATKQAQILSTLIAQLGLPAPVVNASRTGAGDRRQDADEWNEKWDVQINGMRWSTGGETGCAGQKGAYHEQEKGADQRDALFCSLNC